MNSRTPSIRRDLRQEITDSIIARLEEFPHVDRAYVHVEPHDWKD